MVINATLSVSQTPTTTNPYGLFDFEFTGYPMVNSQAGTTAFMQGYVHSRLNSSNQQQLEFVQSETKGGGGGNSQLSQVILVGNGTDTGYGQISMPLMSSGPGNAIQKLSVAYNTNLFLQNATVNDASTQTCLNRANPSTVVYQYGVYNNDGSVLVATNSGYPVIYNGQNGYLSYYGLGLPNGNAPIDKSAVQYIPIFIIRPIKITLYQ